LINYVCCKSVRGIFLLYCLLHDTPQGWLKGHSNTNESNTRLAKLLVTLKSKTCGLLNEPIVAKQSLIDFGFHRLQAKYKNGTTYIQQLLEFSSLNFAKRSKARVSSSIAYPIYSTPVSSLKVVPANRKQTAFSNEKEVVTPKRPKLSPYNATAPNFFAR